MAYVLAMWLLHHISTDVEFAEEVGQFSITAYELYVSGGDLESYLDDVLA